MPMDATSRIHKIDADSEQRNGINHESFDMVQFNNKFSKASENADNNLCSLSNRI